MWGDIYTITVLLFFATMWRSVSAQEEKKKCREKKFTFDRGKTAANVRQGLGFALTTPILFIQGRRKGEQIISI